MQRPIITLAVCFVAAQAMALEPIPDKLVVLTFDDSVRSHFTIVREELLKHGFGATFFITEGFDFPTNKTDYMTWEEIAQLHQDGFEIGNHTRDHRVLKEDDPETIRALREQIEAINDQCARHGIARTTSFAYPGNGLASDALPILRELGIQFARRGGAPEFPYDEGRGVAYEPGLDHPLLIPSAGDARPNWTADDFLRAVQQARFGRIAVLQFHGAPDTAHAWVNTPEDRFRQYMQYLAENDYTVIAMRDLAKYVDPEISPKDSGAVIADRSRRIAAGESLDNCRTPRNEADLEFWLQNMVWHHRYRVAEIRAATGLSADDITSALERLGISEETRPGRAQDSPLLVLPYPGGRHPRIGFLDGAIRPQRDTKLSVFAPWNDADYFVLDLPEAIRRNDESEHGLLYLAHTHVDTMWTKQGKALEPVEWQRTIDGAWTMERRLPGNVTFGTRVRPTKDALWMEIWLDNGSNEPLRDMRVQNCIMLKGAPEFTHSGMETLYRSEPYVARRSRSRNRWIITAWTPHHSTWFNPPCPCLHSDGRFPDCQPGESARLKGWFSFYTGDDIQSEIQRIDATGWQHED